MVVKYSCQGHMQTICVKYMCKTDYYELLSYLEFKNIICLLEEVEFFRIYDLTSRGWSKEPQTFEDTFMY